MAKKDEIFKSLGINKYYPLVFSLLLILVTFQYPFSGLEAFFYDLRIRLDFGTSFKNNIVVITLDDESDNFLGESYPYTYSSHGRLVNRLLKDRPAIVNYLVNFQQPESVAEKENLQTFKKLLINYKNSDGLLRIGTGMDTWGEITPPKELEDIGYSLALLNIDNYTFARDNICRRALLDISGDSSLHLWTANKYREKKQMSSKSGLDYKGAYYNSEADATFALFRYYINPAPKKSSLIKIPFHRVLVGNFPRGFFTDKIVLIGPEYAANSSDFLYTPFNKNNITASKLGVHASIIQALIKGKTVSSVPQPVIQFLCIMLALVLSFYISRKSPVKGLAATFLALLVLIVISYLLFCFFGVWIYLAHFVLAIFIVYYIWVPFRAIVEYQRRYKFQEETKLLKQVDKLKQNFISLMSHDLKTPVAKITGVAELLLNQYQHGEDEKKYLKSIINSTVELNKFITSILDLTKIESSELDLNFVSKDINILIESIVETLNFEARDRSIKIEKDLAPLYPIKVDEVLIKRVFSNLVENAIKYSGESSQVSIKTWDDQNFVYTEIKDTGAGIPDEDLALIFDKFYRVKNDASHQIKGSGLGLYLVRYFVELHGGDISVTSKVGQGTTFLVKLKNE